jgi:hypothetical protein
MLGGGVMQEGDEEESLGSVSGRLLQMGLTGRFTH